MTKKVRAKRAPAAKPAVPSEAQDDALARKRDRELFLRGLLTRGEAAHAEAGKLPPGATHEIVEEREGELPKVVRKRFSAV